MRLYNYFKKGLIKWWAGVGLTSHARTPPPHRLPLDFFSDSIAEKITVIRNADKIARSKYISRFVDKPSQDPNPSRPNIVVTSMLCTSDGRTHKTSATRQHIMHVLNLSYLNILLEIVGSKMSYGNPFLCCIHVIIVFLYIPLRNYNIINAAVLVI